MISGNDEMSMRQSIQGVVFDLDGTLVDSRLDFEAMRREIGLPAGTPVLEGVAALSPGDAPRAWEILERHERAGAEIATVVPGVRELLEDLHQSGRRIAIITRNGRSFARATLARLELPIDLVISRDDAPPKPHPAGLVQILQAWQVPPPRAAIVGDYRFDLEAGRAAGMRTVLYSADSTESELAAWRPLTDFVVESFVECRRLLDWLDRPIRATRLP
jgi:HAD superfamily hydrolase (TIGR01509 family)